MSFTSLGNIFSAQLIQEIDWKERFNPCICPCPSSMIFPIINPCDRENTYYLLQSDDHFISAGQKIIEFKESSNFFQRCLIPPCRRSFNLEGKNFYEEVIIKCTRPYLCSFFCAARPEIQVIYRDQFIGSVKNPFTIDCGLLNLIIYDKNGSRTYSISATCTQCGIYCFIPFESCQFITFCIKNKQNNEIGSIKHIFQDCKKEYCTKSDLYGIQFPFNSTVEEKILISVAAIFIDYLLFENC